MGFYFMPHDSPSPWIKYGLNEESVTRMYGMKNSWMIWLWIYNYGHKKKDQKDQIENEFK